MTNHIDAMLERVRGASGIDLRSCYRDPDGRIWSVEGVWAHPQHKDYHKGWSGDYVIAQEYGNFTNEIRMIKAEDWRANYSLAWEPMKVCKFCGFTRMSPCETRQTCPNLTDYRLEPDDDPLQSQDPK